MTRLTRAKAIWDFEGIFCSSRHIPGVRFPGLIHPGIIACAPSAEVLAEWNRREGELITANATSDREVAKPPEPQGAHSGSAPDHLREKVAREGARTIPVCNNRPRKVFNQNILIGIGPSRTRRKLRHQKPLSGLENLPPRACPRSQILRW